METNEPEVKITIRRAINAIAVLAASSRLAAKAVRDFISGLVGDPWHDCGNSTTRRVWAPC
jgi:hypothetical protein